MRWFTLLLLCAALAQTRAETDAAGRWEGLARVPGQDVTLIVDLARNGDGNWHGALTIPRFNVKGAALADISVTATDISFAANTLSANNVSGPKIQAQFSPDGALNGDFTLAGNRAAVTLRKVGPADIEPPPKSTAIASNLEGEWHGQYELFGYPRKVTLKLANRPENGATAEFVIVGKKVNTLPVDLVTQTGDFLTVRSQETGLSLEGQVTKDAINAAVLQGPLEIPVKLTRAK